MERLTEYDEFGNAEFVGIDNTKLYERLVCDETVALTIATNKLAKLEDVLEEFELTSAEDLRNYLNFQDNMGTICESKLDLKNKIADLEQELAELKQKAIVLPFEFDKPFYKLCPKCNEKQTNCEHCAWGGCGFNQCYDICQKENKGQIIREITLKKDNCNISWNALRFISEHWGEYYFATKEEAEQKLAQLKGEE